MSLFSRLISCNLEYIMTSMAYNLVWLNLRTVQSGANHAEAPMPPEYIFNLQSVCELNPNSDVILWIDSARMTSRQQEILDYYIRNMPHENFTIKDLADIEEYRTNPLFTSNAHTVNGNAANYQSAIWGMVNLARLIALRNCGDYDQIMYADMDQTDLEMGGSAIQNRLRTNGVFFGQCTRKYSNATHGQNGVMGFSKQKMDFLNSFYQTIKAELIFCYQSGTEHRYYCAFGHFLQQVSKIKRQVNDPMILFIDIKDIGVPAYDPREINVNPLRVFEPV